MSFQFEALRESINEIHVNLNSFCNWQIAKKSSIHKAFQGLVGSSRIPEVTEQQVSVGAFELMEQLFPFQLGQVAQKAGGIALVKNSHKAQAALQPVGKLPALKGLGLGLS